MAVTPDLWQRSATAELKSLMANHKSVIRVLLAGEGSNVAEKACVTMACRLALMDIVNEQGEDDA